MLRVSYGRAGRPTPRPSLEDALADAATLLGVELSVDDVVEHGHRFPELAAAADPEHRERVEALTAAAAELDGFEITGAWYAGTGLAAVVPHDARWPRSSW